MFSKIRVWLKIEQLTLFISELSRSSPLSGHIANAFPLLTFVSFTFISTLARTFLVTRLLQSESLLFSGGFLFSLGIFILLGIAVFFPFQISKKYVTYLVEVSKIPYTLTMIFPHFPYNYTSITCYNSNFENRLFQKVLPSLLCCGWYFSNNASSSSCFFLW